MSDLILKKHGAHAYGSFSKTKDGRYRTTLLVQDHAKNIQQQRGPEFLSSAASAQEWLLKQARLHGFTGGDFDIDDEGVEE